MNKTNQNQAKQPIPPPNHPKQYRAIGLIRGKYKNTEEKLTKGFLTINETQIIDAVLLGKMISVIKNHVDLDKEHLWVVYPHTSSDNDDFHFQIAGIWEPETLKKDSIISTISEDSWQFKHGYFSIRGEVIFYAKEEQKVIVKIIQSFNKKSQKIDCFKLQLQGILPNYCLGHFMSFDVLFEHNILRIKKYNDLGLLPSRIKQNKRFYSSE